MAVTHYDTGNGPVCQYRASAKQWSKDASKVNCIDCRRRSGFPLLVHWISPRRKIACGMWFVREAFVDSEKRAVTCRSCRKAM